MTGKLVTLALGLAACSPDACSSSRAMARDAQPPPFEIRDDMVTVPAGWFTAGCSRILARADVPSRNLDKDTDPDYERAAYCVEEDPPRRLWISSFAMDRVAVTNAEYAACLREKRCKGIQSEFAHHQDWHDGKRVLADDYAAEVTFDDADTFCAWRGKKLPTGAEWQKAGRGTDGRIFPWGDDPRNKCVWVEHNQQDGAETDPRCTMWVRAVGSYPDEQSPYGVQDLRGPLAQWVQDLSRFRDGWVVRSPKHGSQYGDLRFSLEADPGFAVVVLDWSSLEVMNVDPKVIDPKGQGVYPQSGRDHQTRGRDGTLNATALGREDHAAFRCVRSIPGPPPPVVTSPPANVFAPPFREPGFMPPGTLAAPERKAPSR